MASFKAFQRSQVFMSFSFLRSVSLTSDFGGEFETESNNDTDSTVPKKRLEKRSPNQLVIAFLSRRGARKRRP